MARSKAVEITLSEGERSELQALCGGRGPAQALRCARGSSCWRRRGEPIRIIVYAWYGGSFEPFSAEELKARYLSREAYVELVSKAAAALLADRLILQEDYDAYVRSAEIQRW
jgi:hypothetical protein